MLLTVLTFSITGCSGSRDAEPVEAAGCDVSVLRLSLADSIGIELGDSNYVFAIVIDATYLTDGRIAVLDMGRKKVLIYSGEGEFITEAGSEGSGPGEFLLPFSIAALSDGGFAVSDIHGGKVSFFDANGSLQRELKGFYPMAPMSIETGPDGSIIGKRSNYYYDQEQDNLISGHEFGIWSDSVEPDQVLLESYAEHGSGNRIAYNFASSYDGRFFCCPSSKDTYVVTGFNLDGDTAFCTEVPWETTMMTREEIDAARPGIVVPGPGSEATMSELTANWEPDSVRNAGQLVGVDGEDRLWVKSGRGESPSPAFDLFSCEDGSLLGSIETSLPPIARYWNFVVTDSGILGWDHNPDDYPRVYILELVGGDHF